MRMCDACRGRACASCAEADCDCFSVYVTWRDYHAALLRPRARRHAELPAPHPFTGRHASYLNYKLDRLGHRRKVDTQLP